MTSLVALQRDGAALPAVRMGGWHGVPGWYGPWVPLGRIPRTHIPPVYTSLLVHNRVNDRVNNRVHIEQNGSKVDSSTLDSWRCKELRLRYVLKY